MLKYKTLSEVRREVQNGQPFDLEVCTLDEKRGTGGERVKYEKVRFVQGSEKGVNAELPEDLVTDAVDRKGGVTRNPHHLWHGTFNVRLQNKQVRKLHWLLIELFNGYPVIL